MRNFVALVVLVTLAYEAQCIGDSVKWNPAGKTQEGEYHAACTQLVDKVKIAVRGNTNRDFDDKDTLVKWRPHNVMHFALEFAFFHDVKTLIYKHYRSIMVDLKPEDRTPHMKEMHIILEVVEQFEQTEIERLHKLARTHIDAAKAQFSEGSFETFRKWMQQTAPRSGELFDIITARTVTELRKRTGTERTPIEINKEVHATKGICKVLPDLDASFITVITENCNRTVASVKGLLRAVKINQDAAKAISYTVDYTTIHKNPVYATELENYFETFFNRAIEGTKTSQLRKIRRGYTKLIENITTAQNKAELLLSQYNFDNDHFNAIKSYFNMAKDQRYQEIEAMSESLREYVFEDEIILNSDRVLDDAELRRQQEEHNRVVGQLSESGTGESSGSAPSPRSRAESAAGAEAEKRISTEDVDFEP